MARICDYCGRGIAYGNAVSHAKNRVKRLFKPNLQKLKVLRDGDIVRVKFCTSCIQRLKRDKHMGLYKSINYLPTVADELAKSQVKVSGKKEVAKPSESMKIEDIVGKS
ncbi:MAG: 50S ribosomal protein L28, large subunit ribosomal protein L28 [Candidatus Gottesmanbacteria bacterium GW2011_GWA2_43_14]|uniref:Large ribosomal subunit protein bL28 n=1 Tax=Candidatus Gottesmanbacteria bacterium GW2011_GWA2_43_14 TaxID=1618443 RepID=A0A0G1DCJ7_9BACT|nr:MAG: 50S ribosomal protein L28, large subunit ribosomal protein L28 [Candidatus Gottesmanbacteria bacterium GW2011_GWA2_43_14]